MGGRTGGTGWEGIQAFLHPSPTSLASATFPHFNPIPFIPRRALPLSTKPVPYAYASQNLPHFHLAGGRAGTRARCARRALARSVTRRSKTPSAVAGVGPA